MIIMLIFAGVIPLGFGIFFLCHTIEERGSFIEHIGNILLTILIFIASGFIGLLILGGSSQFISTTFEPQTYVFEEEIIELQPVAKSYFVSLTMDSDGDYVYNYAFMKNENRMMGKAYAPRYIALNENNEDIPTLIIRHRKYSNVFLRYMFLTENQYEFNIPTNSVLNLGIPVI